MYTQLAILIAFFLYYQIVKYLTYWKRHGVHQCSVAKTLKNNFDILINRLSQAELFRTHCKSFSNHRYFGIYQAFQKCLIIQDPELIKQITVKDFDHFVNHAAFSNGTEPLWDRNVFALEGNEWKNMRAALNTSTTSSKLKIMFNLVEERCKEFVDHFHKQQLNSEVNLKDAYFRFASDIMATFVFEHKCDSLKHPHNDFYVKINLLFPEYNAVEIVKRFLLLNVPKIGSFFGTNFYNKLGASYFRKLVTSKLHERENTNVVHNDVVQALIEAKRQKGKIALDDIDIAAQAAVFFFAGIESVSSTLCFITYELAAHVEVQQRLQAEIDEVIENCQGTLTYSTLQDMKYMNMVISESLRKWPPLFVDRKCSKPYVIQPKMNGEVPVHLNKGDIILLPIRDIHRNPNNYANPNEFDPERFNDENKEKVNPYSYFPFGVGPRTCLAKRFALMEIKLLVFHILSKFDIGIIDKTVDPNEFGNISGLTMEISEYWLGLRPRVNIS